MNRRWAFNTLDFDYQFFLDEQVDSETEGETFTLIVEWDDQLTLDMYATSA
nr:hypothetical protein [Gemmatimonas phototrophica]